MGYEEKINGEPSKVEEPDLAGSYTAGDYINWTYDMLMELIHGKVHKMSPAPTSVHQRIFTRLLGNFYNSLSGNSCQLWGAPFDVYLVEKDQHYKDAAHVVQPDICIVCDENKIKKFGCVGAPDFIIEILSPSTARKDASIKLELYREFGVKEYWMVAPAEKMILIHTLTADGSYKPHKPCVDGLLAPRQFPMATIDVRALFKE